MKYLDPLGGLTTTLTCLDFHFGATFGSLIAVWTF